MDNHPEDAEEPEPSPLEKQAQSREVTDYLEDEERHS
jgi:hypothetical protein